MTDELEPRVASVAEGLRKDEPIKRVERETAAVAVIFGPGEEGLLLIKRADRQGDPWSGDIAFPGGRVEAEDTSFSAAAVREAREEVGVDLAANARFLGYMAPFQARRRGIWVVPSVFLITGAVAVERNSEVSSYMWVPIREILAHENRSTYSIELGDDKRSFPSFNLQGYVVWGLTERILSSLVESMTGRDE
ncbi:MAG: CoA pyrophosphatase [Thaumarchaeota archaeon]|nr:CoA pyrophosphatase [Nitrososphaerota archaeon]